jgi:hypothetical protein
VPVARVISKARTRPFGDYRDSETKMEESRLGMNAVILINDRHIRLGLSHMFGNLEQKLCWVDCKRV